VPQFVAGLQSGQLLSLADSRYVLVEPPHHVLPLRLEDFLFELLVAGYVPILTHPERLSWIKSHYTAIQRMVRGGVWMQITAGSLTGAFGRTAQYWSERMLDEGGVHIVATDAHDLLRRAPNLSEGRELAARRVGTDEAERLVASRARGVIANEPVSNIPMPAAVVLSEVAYAPSGRCGNDRDGREARARSRRGSAHCRRWFPDRLRRFFE
jgi:protein-tyrosine phosphatase